MTRAIIPFTISSFKVLMRNKQALYFSLVLPVLIVLVFGLVAGDNTIGDSGMLYKDFVIPGLIALTTLQLGVFSVAFLISQYKEKGVLKKLVTTPVRPADFLGGQILARLSISLIQIFLLLSTAILAFSFTMSGSYLAFTVVGLLGSLVFLALGFMIAGLAKNTETVPAIANMIVFPMLFFGDVFFPVESLPSWLAPIAKILPIQYLAEGFREVMLNSASLSGVNEQLLGMFIWLLIIFFLAQKVFKLNTSKQ